MNMHVLIAGVVLVMAGCGPEGTWEEADAAARPGAEVPQDDTPLADIDPCSLLTEGEIRTALESSLHPDQLEGRREKGITYDVYSQQLSRQGMWPVCTIVYRSMDPANPPDPQRSGVEFQVHVMNADDMRMLAELDRRDDIEGLGDEAFYIENAPYARVGALAVGITQFPEAGELALLRAAAQRLPQ
jgi:hypothetical protein